MRHIISIVIACLSFSCIAQNQVTTTLWDYKYMMQEWKVKKTCGDDGTCFKAFTMTFDNKEYQHIDDWGVVVLTSVDEVQTFIDKLSEFAEMRSSDEVRWQGGEYTLENTFMGSQLAFTITDKEGKWDGINRKKAIKKIIPELRECLQYMD